MSDAVAGAPRVTVHVFGRTDVGRTRTHNEDAFVVADLSTDRATLHPEVRTHAVGPLGTLFMVADGMGGAAAGEIASQLAIETVLRILREHWTPAPRHDAATFAATLRRAAEEANAAIHAYAVKHPENRGMGSTATIAGLLDDTLFLAQVGDSRGYLLRDGVARQITKDQSLVQRLIDAGELTEEEAERSDRRNIILQALGPEALVRIDLTHQRVRHGDTLVLCSDGLTGELRGDDIARVVTAQADPMAACKELIDLANAHGGKDNITVIVARVDGEALGAATDDEDVRHRVFVVPGEEHATTPIPALDDPRVLTDPTAPLIRKTQPTQSTPVVPLPVEPRGPSLATLRLWFGLLAALIAGYFLLRWLGGAPPAP